MRSKASAHATSSAALPTGVLLCAAALLAASQSARAEEPKASYVGVDRCKVCHLEQFTVWKNSKHSHALEALGDKRNNPECLPCHVTGLAGPKDPSAGDLSGVQCEACHGPGSRYKSPILMSKTKFAANRQEAERAVVAAGLTLPDEKVCITCHNSKSPEFKGFDFASAKEKIKHWK